MSNPHIYLEDYFSNFQGINIIDKNYTNNSTTNISSTDAIFEPEQKNSIFMLLIPNLFISIMTVGLIIPSTTGINENVKEMFIYDKCCISLTKTIVL